MKYCLQTCPGLHIIFYRLKKTHLFGTDPCKNHIVNIKICFSVNMNNYVKMIIPSNIANAKSIKRITIRYSFQKNIQPYQQIKWSDKCGEVKRNIPREM